MKILCLIAAVVAVIFVACLLIVVILEKEGYNNGICPKCGHPLRHFDNCSNNELWTCDNCGYFTSVYYKKFVYRKRTTCNKKEDISVIKTDDERQ